MTSPLVEQANVLFNNYGTRQIAIERGEGPFVYDTSGKQYLDLTAGIAVCSLGHADPGLAKVIGEQASKIMHTSNLFLVPGQVTLAAKLVALSKIPNAKAMFVNSGAEANETALKLARRYHFLNTPDQPRTKIVSLPHAFHGRTMGALSLTPKPAYHEGFAPLVPDCVTPDSLEGVLEAIDESCAGCIVEIVQGEAGVLPLPQSFLQALRTKLDEVCGLLIIDEVQTGVGRTGTFFAYESYDVEPDIVTMAKGLGNGFPVGAVIAREEVAGAFTPGAHGTTFGGNPLAMAAANYVVDVVSDEVFLGHVCAIGSTFKDILLKRFSNVSGLGLMWGFDVTDADLFVKVASEVGLLVTKCGPSRIRVVPPLTLNEAHVRMAAELFDKVLQEISVPV